ncbi:hypothetical protein [Lentibacter sp. XHP0401]|uniref:hypothetical protein n=1 Tax=Lentibacter sp. XHP0401 TaxID=2984334 RepID=UPI0021E7DF3F|nr:hypothetical protein [Lentibacter sp. XHP0401]MCV2893350.1 hypothetical protein [Lentibacter sp. XHP0401]
MAGFRASPTTDIEKCLKRDKLPIMVKDISVEPSITGNVDPSAIAFTFAQKIYAEAGVSLKPRIRGDSYT